MMERAAVAQRHPDQAALGRLGRLADRLGHLARLAGAVADPAALVADHHDGGEGEAPAALHHLGDAIDGDQLVGQFVFLVALAVAAPLTLARGAAGTGWGTSHVLTPQNVRPPSRAAVASAATRP